MISVVVVALRPAGPADAAFLADMVAAAAFWRLDGPTGTVEEVMAEPQLAHYVAGWPQPGDSGVIAEDTGPVGAAWLRYFPDSDPGFGFVDAATPELFRTTTWTTLTGAETHYFAASSALPCR